MRKPLADLRGGEDADEARALQRDVACVVWGEGTQDDEPTLPLLLPREDSVYPSQAGTSN
jgi:hypothetical protein